MSDLTQGLKEAKLQLWLELYCQESRVYLVCRGAAYDRMIGASKIRARGVAKGC